MLISKQRGDHVAAGWSTLILCVGSAAAGWFANDWLVTRSQLQQSEALRTSLEASAEKLVTADRSLTVKQERNQGYQRKAEEVIRTSDLSGCPAPPDLGRLLQLQIEETNRALGPAETVPVSGQGDARVRGSPQS